MQTTSSAHIATRSTPSPLNRWSETPIAVFVPTPSVEETSSGSSIAGRDRHGRGETTKTAHDLRPPGRLDVGPHQLDRAVAGGDIDPGVGVGAPHEVGHVPLPAPTASTSSSRRNLWFVASYGTGTG